MKPLAEGVSQPAPRPGPGMLSAGGSQLALPT